jgi:Tfp pilus assembly PilM family ATPase
MRIYNGSGMRPFTTHTLVAFDRETVGAAAIRRGLGRARLRAHAVAPLAEGALTVSAHGTNVVNPAALLAALQELASFRPARPGAVTLVLPQGVARTGLLELPAGSSGREYARFRMGGSLPYPVDEAVIDVLPLGPRRVLAAAVRRSVVAEYEDAAAAAGFVGARVDLLSLAAAASIGRTAPQWATPGVILVLGDACCAVAAFDSEGRLAAFRTRRRDTSAGEAQRLRLEALRAAALAGIPADGALFATGPGARGLADHLAAAGHAIEVKSLVPGLGLAHETASFPWMGAALA